MSNRLLKRAMNHIDQLPRSEFENLIWRQIAEADMLSVILDSGKVGHCVISKDGNVIYTNTLFFALLPTDRSYLNNSEGCRLGDILLDKEVLSYAKSCFSGKGEDEKEFYFQNGAELKVVLMFYRHLHTEEGDYTDISAIDITEDKRKETRLRRSESLASMTTMAAGIAHEIKNPLAAMQIHLQLLRKAFEKKGSLTGEMAERYLSVLEEEISHLNGIAVDFLFAVRPMDVDLRLQHIKPMIDNLAAFVHPELKEHNISFTVKVDEFLPKLEIDVNYLKQALLNIIKNAMNAMETGGRLTLKVKQSGDFVEISIRDTGCGIDRDSLSKIFEPYFTTKDTGTGLGLTVVYKVVKEHKGDISVESTVGKGTVFTIKLPIPHSERVQLADNREE